MGKPQVAPYGSWKSPVTSELVASKKVWLESIVFDGEDIYWVEIRPSEEGRHIIVRRTPDGQISDMTPPPLNARSRVHEYGGGAYTVGDGTIYFSNFDDQRIYCQKLGGAPRALGKSKKYFTL